MVDQKNNKDPYKLLGITKESTTEEINDAYKKALSQVQNKNRGHPDKMIIDSDNIYNAYRQVMMNKEGVREDQIMSIPDITIFGVTFPMFAMPSADSSDPRVQIQMQSSAQYKDGQLVEKKSSRSETFRNKDGKLETKVWENGKLVKHTIDGKDVSLK